jgi:hypothetical protein
MNNNKHQSKASDKAGCFWILGAGRFGRIAIERIRRHIPGAAITVIDKKPFEINGDGINVITTDAIQWLCENLHQHAPVDLILPAVPIHVAVAWLRLSFKGDMLPILISDERLAQMPNAMRGNTGQVYVSHADFVCPDNCSEPKDRCTITGKPRPTDLFRLLADLAFDEILPIIIRSHQLLPGVGGIEPDDLLAALDQLYQMRGRQVMIATACRCHGVVAFLEIK